MVFKTTSTKKRKSLGFTLIEMLVSAAIGSMIIASTAAIIVYSTRSFAALWNYVELDQDSRNALDELTRDIRQADSLSSFEENKIILNFDGGKPLTFEWNPNTETLIRTYEGETKTLLEGCKWLQFSIYQRNPIGGSYDQWPTATATTAKLIQVSWRCAREITGAELNTESVQSAKIVIRRQ